ncbi:DNA polymerase III subunit chi [Thiomicrorhabdus cannonii]|uniref:DNA polymerase III subunit chi n=1 Tax=Thiomicrorhabdus cannonii TaxID=2748011 RepID=UPI0015BBE382|nr:DNA polymerase III subunit chi [Thiomicrorhabdus cannonii]
MTENVQTLQTAASQDVLFYVLNSTEPQKRERFLSKLLQKIQNEQRRADVRFENEHEAQRYDLTLWDTQPQSFIVHSVARQVAAPIQLYGEHIPKPCEDVLVNLHPQFPQEFSRYQRTIEILDQTDYLVQMGRERYKAYKAQGIEPTVHKIGF